ncbi:MAG: alcohol dehydrogenase catalytic domain-containing protein [Candidatus Omnitrophota bacterium]
MRVAMYYNNWDVRIEEMPKPKIGPGEILVKMKACGICGSDVMEWYRIKKAPLVLGHEMSGEIVEVDSGVKGYKPKAKVFVSHHVPCNTCRYCLNNQHTACETLHTTNYFPGGFSEYIRVPALNVDRGVFLIPKEISFDEATFIEPLACVLRAQILAGLKPGQTVLILGSGISGLIHLLNAKALGAGRVITTDIQEYRMQKAQELGADLVINAKEDIPKRVLAANENRLADLVIVCAGNLSVFQQALQSVDRGGTILCFASTEPGVDLGLPINDFWHKGIKILPSYGNSPADAIMAIDLLKTGRISLAQLITHRLPLEEAAKGFGLVSKGKDCIKVILTNPA